MRKEELSDSINAALDYAMANLHTMTVCKITEVNETTINCRPVINRMVNDESKQLPEFIEVPPIFLHGGASYLAMPLAVDDYCLLFISERCFDSWYFGSDYVKPLDPRMHDYSDGFALVGIQNKAGAIAIPDVITMIGDALMEGDHTHNGNMTRTGNVEHIGDTTQTGNLAQTGLLTVSGAIESQAMVKAPVFQAGNGWSGSFATGDSRTVTVVDGIITGVS